MKVSVLTLGCRVNQSESDIIESNLKKYGWSIVGLCEYPDYCIVNTCTVTSKSDYQSRQLIRRAVRSGAEVIVTGCYSQIRPDEIRNIKGNISIIDNNDKLRIINMLTGKLSSNAYNYGSRSRPYLKIQDGCNFACTYCTIPIARGKSRSLSVQEIVRQAKEIEEANFNEIVLTGINIGTYGFDLNPTTKLSTLIKTLLRETKIKRIRLSSIEVKNVNKELIELFQENRICKHLHLPLQSGDDYILKLMNRNYTSKYYIKTLENIVKNIPDIAVGTDVVVGFPGEGRREFLNTKNLLDYLPITYLHIFPFSSRPNTLASKMSMQTSFTIKKERYNELKALNIHKKKSYLLTQLNKTLDVIVEEQCMDNTSVGTSSNYLKVKMPFNGYPKGSLIDVWVYGIETDFVYAKPIYMM